MPHSDVTTPPRFPIPLEASWSKILADEFKQKYMFDLLSFLQQEWSGPAPIYPRRECVFHALNATPFEQVSVVIMGQDPYHGANQAHGLSFSVLPGITPPPSLKNIYKELHDDVGITMPTSGYLQPWAEQGVLLLNATLTVRSKQPASHCGRGWERFTDAIIARLVERQRPVIFVLWGKNAQNKVLGIESHHHQKQHTILTAAHPSPYSAYQGFFGCRHFSQINALLEQQGKKPIDWQIE